MSSASVSASTEPTSGPLVQKKSSTDGGVIALAVALPIATMGLIALAAAFLYRRQRREQTVLFPAPEEGVDNAGIWLPDGQLSNGDVVEEIPEHVDLARQSEMGDTKV